MSFERFNTSTQRRQWYQYLQCRNCNEFGSLEYPGTTEMLDLFSNIEFLWGKHFKHEETVINKAWFAFVRILSIEICLKLLEALTNTISIDAGFTGTSWNIRNAEFCFYRELLDKLSWIASGFQKSSNKFHIGFEAFKIHLNPHRSISQLRWDI